MNEQERAEMTDMEKKEPGKKSIFGRIFRVMAIAEVILAAGFSLAEDSL